MRILAFVQYYWDDQHPANRDSGTYSSLVAWEKRVRSLWNPIELFIASGTWSEPSQSPIQVAVVNAGCPNVGSYNIYCRHYSKGAFTAAMAYALNRNDWDLLLTIDNDSLIGDVDFDKLLREFINRKELLLTPAWMMWIGGPFFAFKREGAARLLHKRQTANLHYDEDDKHEPLLIENEIAQIFRNGRWWNPWPEITLTTDDRSASVLPCELNWPFLRNPRAELAARYISEKCPLSRPVLPDQ